MEDGNDYKMKELMYKKDNNLRKSYNIIVMLLFAFLVISVYTNFSVNNNNEFTK